jgi:hypothetical protein
VIGQYAREKAGWAHLPADDTTHPDVKKHVKRTICESRD